MKVSRCIDWILDNQNQLDFRIVDKLLLFICTKAAVKANWSIIQNCGGKVGKMFFMKMNQIPVALKRMFT